MSLNHTCIYYWMLKIIQVARYVITSTYEHHLTQDTGILQSHSEPENKFLEKEGRIPSASFSTTFIRVERRALSPYRTAGSIPHLSLWVTELSFLSFIIRKYLNYNLQLPNYLKLLGYSFCLKSLGRDPGHTFLSIQKQSQCSCSKLTGQHVASNSSCPTTSHCLNVTQAMQGAANQQKHHNSVPFCDFFHHSVPHFR